MRNRELSRTEQRWARQDLFGQRRRRRPWKAVLVVLVLVAMTFALSRTDLGGLWGTMQSRLPAPEGASEPVGDPDRLPLPPPRQG